MTWTNAIEADQNQDIERAVELYESEIADSAPSIDTYLNLLVLYWQITEYGFWVGRGLSLDFVSRVHIRLPELKGIVQELFEDNPGVLFWISFINWFDLGELYDPKEARALLQAYPSYLEPAMYLYSITHLTQGQAL